MKTVFKQSGCYATLVLSVVLSACGGDSNGSINPLPSPVGDTVAPTVSFDPTTITIDSGANGSSTLTATDNVGVTSGPTTECDNGGSFSANTFTAPSVTAITTVTCTATAGDAAGNEGTAVLTVTVNPVNTPPNASAMSDKTAEHEGQIFTLDASESTDPENDNLTFSWSQIAGPSVSIADNELATLSNLEIPELTETVTATFEVTVNDGTDTSRATVNVEFQNIMQMPRFTDAPPLFSKAIFIDQLETIFAGFVAPRKVYAGTSTQQGGDITITELGLNNNELFVSTSLPITSGIEQPVQFIENELGVNHITIQENLDKILTPLELSIQKPCGAHPQFRRVGGSANIHIGQRNNGFSLVLYDLDYPIDREPYVFKKAGTTESFCALYVAERPLQEATFDDSDYRHLEDVVALDVNTNTLHVFEQDDTNDIDGVQYRLRETVALDLQTTANLNFVDSEPVKTLFNGLGLALVFSDGLHSGTHRLIVVGMDKNRNVVQETHSWEIGAPSKVIFDNITLDVFPEIVIISETSPEAIVFLAQNALGGLLLPLTGPSYFEIGLGAIDALAARHNLLGEHLLYIADRKNNEVRAYGTLD